MVSSCCARRKSFSFLFRSAPLALSLPPLPCRNSFLFITSASLLTACTNNNRVQSLVCHKQQVFSHWSATSTVTTPRHKQQQCTVTGLPQTTTACSHWSATSTVTTPCGHWSATSTVTTPCSHWSATSTVTTPRYKQQQHTVTGLPST